MWNFLTHLFDTGGFVPRSMCGDWSTAHRLVHQIADLGTWSAYVAIPFVLLYFLMRRRDIPFGWMLGLFGLFILACGTGHLIEAGMFYWPLYRLSAVVKVVTAAASWATVGALVTLVPKVLTLRSPRELEREIAERKRAEAALSASEATFRSAFEYAAFGMTMISPDGRYRKVNRAFCEMVGYSEEELLSRTFRDITEPADIAADEINLRRLLEGEIPVYRVEKRYRSQDGRQVWVLLTLSVLQQPAGCPVALVSQVHDITARKEAEADQAEHARQLDEKNQQLLAAERWKNDFFSRVSHELRTPLTLILAPLETLLAGDEGPLPAGAGRLLTTAHVNSTRLLQMVNGLLDLSRIQADQSEVHREPLAIEPLTDSIFRDFAPLLRQRRLSGRLATSLESPAVAMDRYLYERILFNLLSNAAKFTPAGGRIEVALSSGGGRLRVVVSDTGQGIAAEDLGTLFQKYKQLGHGSARRFEGTGLGLSLVKEFAELLGGSVTVESVPGHGSSFLVDVAAPACPADQASREPLPRSWPAPIAEAPDGMETDAGEPGGVAPDAVVTDGEEPHGVVTDSAAEADLPRVLIVEDNDELAAYTRDLLRGFCRTEVVGDGDAALERVRSWRPELVLSDVMIPARSGVSLCQELKSDGATAAVQVVLLTAMTDREALLRGWEAGADEYLFKPFHPRELETRVRSLLASGAARRRAERLEHERVSLLHSLEQRRMIEDSLQAAKTAAEAASRAKSEFLANMSHEIRTPLSAILALNSLLLSTDLTREQREYLQTTKNSADALLRLLNDILDFSKIEAGKMDFISQAFAVRQLLDDTFRALAVQAGLKSLRLRYRVAAGVPDDLLGDPGRLRQVLVNLVGNAIKFTEFGAVDLHVGPAGAMAAEVGCEEQPEARNEGNGSGEPTVLLQFAVRDTGIGISADQQSLIFGAFAQADASASRRFGGTGLGLTIAARLVELMGGRIWLESAAGSGSTFYFTARFGVQALAAGEQRRAAASAEFGLGVQLLAMSGRPAPAAMGMVEQGSSTADEARAAATGGAEGAAARQHLRALAGEPGDKLRILLAEDTPANQLVARRVLEKQGHLVALASDGAEAIELWRQAEYDLILMDVQMPNVDGLAATRQIRAEERAAGEGPVTIVALTAHALKGDQERCLEAGMNGYLAKPIDVEVLLRMLATLTPPGAGNGHGGGADGATGEGPRQDVGAPADGQGGTAPGAGPAETVEFDREAMLARLDGDVELFDKLVGYYRQDVPEFLQRVREALHKRQGSELGFAAHRLAGVFRNFAAHSYASLALRMETLGDSEEFAAAAALLPELERVVAAMTAAIDAAASPSASRKIES